MKREESEHFPLQARLLTNLGFPEWPCRYVCMKQSGWQRESAYFTYPHLLPSMGFPPPIQAPLLGEAKDGLESGAVTVTWSAERKPAHHASIFCKKIALILPCVTMTREMERMPSSLLRFCPQSSPFLLILVRLKCHFNAHQYQRSSTNSEEQ